MSASPYNPIARLYDAWSASVTEDVEFSCEDASRSDPDFLCRVVQAAIEEGATTINLPDTVGYALPVEYGAMFRDVLARVPGADRITLCAHCHDDLGLAVAMIALGAALGRTRDDSGQPVGTGDRAQSRTPRGPAL